MKNELIFIVILASISLTACQSTVTAVNNSANNKTANQMSENINAVKIAENTNVTNSNIETNNSTKGNISNNGLETPTAVYKAAYAARKNKDLKALKQLISREMFEFFEIMGGGVDEGLKQLCESPQGASDDCRNEKIKGKKATLEYLDKNGAWKTMDFVKEDGKWKLTLDKLE